MQTESVNERYAEIDRWPTAVAVDVMLEAQMSAVAAVRPEVDAIARAADAAADRLMAGGRLVYVGAGTSGRIAIQDAVELGPTYGWPMDRIVFVLAGGVNALIKSAETAEDDAAAAREQLSAIDLTSSDVLIGVAASGRTPFTLGGIEFGNHKGALTIGVVNNPSSEIQKAAEIGICAETGSEVVAGSTRMKAGTAQKVILNLLSTAIMIRCGRVYKGLMVDMTISNKKLHNRAVAIISQVAEISEEAAASALDDANGEIKTGILYALGADRGRAEKLLLDSSGVLRTAIERFYGKEADVVNGND
ncbi:N-acetylmuramic acid 6-phosphate etherase [Hyphococcus luteus]|uniref:N-acetylmuramic acid 6-phosphate etherase n=1 Tax=Hyphococcus luteus TaxID=2058213 RepID=A0A2S7K9W8_9PROT|nr:N-acetylmuramic acid 6-phosphate etherase [Marinicaulis flavus]PQA89310.1 N-acetylmuramic acid 6-phosphate etherase [Marinicaulis flavus]